MLGALLTFACFQSVYLMYLMVSTSFLPRFSLLLCLEVQLISSLILLLDIPVVMA